MPRDDDVLHIHDTEDAELQSPRRYCCGCVSERHRHSIQTASLCCVSFTNAFLVINLFPYAGYMMMDLVPTATTENAGIYAGLVSGSFFAARFFTVYQWGRFADAHGRLRTLKLALTLSALFSILFGMSKSLFTAILWRGCLGASNCLVSTTKTVATEIAEGSEKLQRRTMGLVVGMRSWGLLIAPAIAGFLAEPATQYPGLLVRISTRCPRIVSLVEIYPFLLPNIFGACCCLVAAAAIDFLLHETLNTSSDTSQSQRAEDPADPNANSVQEETPLLEQRKNETTSRSKQSVWSRPLTRGHMVAHWMFSVISTYVDEAFPLFCISETGGLGLRESDIGTVLSVAGLLFAMLQYATFASLTHTFGLYRSMSIGCWLGTLPAAFMPLALLLRPRTNETVTGSSWWFVPYLSFIMGFTKLFHSLYFTSMAVAINKTVDSRQRGRMNALVQTGNSVAKAFGPSLAGLLVTLSFSSVAFPAEYGSFFVWSLVPVMGAVVACRIRWLQRLVAEHQEKSRVFYEQNC